LQVGDYFSEQIYFFFSSGSGSRAGRPSSGLSGRPKSGLRKKKKRGSVAPVQDSWANENDEDDF